VFNDYLAYDGVEVLNAARAHAYAKAGAPQLTLAPAPDALRTTLGDDPYTTPAGDGAPWYRAAVPASARFWGLLPRGLQGADDSTRTVQTTELNLGGGVHSSARYGSREIRVSAVALAADDEALAAGLAWLRDTVDGSCAAPGLGCDDRTALVLNALPVPSSAADPFRTFYRVQTISSVKVVQNPPFRSCSAAVVEFILSAGVPWAFTPVVRTGTLEMDSGYTSQIDAAGENCSEQDTAYNNFINDPYFTAIAQPPRPLTVAPPNLLPMSSWHRKTLAIPVADADQFGRMVPRLDVRVGANDLSQVRVRFYRSDGPLTGCGYDGEFYISYTPANTTLRIDGIHREISVITAAGPVPGSHLVYGSAGRPFAWPTFSCHNAHTLVVDSAAGNSALNIDLDIAIRE
jgi:hypothetical protein